MEQLELFGQVGSEAGVPPKPYLPGATGSYSGNRWHEVCESRLKGYGYRQVASRYQLSGVMEFDGYFKTGAGMHILAEYKERIDFRTFKELVGQARIGHVLHRGNRLAILVLAGHIDQLVLRKEYAINAASDDIYLIGNPQHPATEGFLRRLAETSPEKLYSISYNNLSQRIMKHGGFVASVSQEYMH